MASFADGIGDAIGALFWFAGCAVAVAALASITVVGLLIYIAAR